MNDNDPPKKNSDKARGFKGRKNIYTCDRCFGHIVTVDLEDGTTPFILKCRATFGCEGRMKSSLYRVADQSMRAGFEWYRPSIIEAAALEPAAAEHVNKGGLLIREAIAT